MDTPTKNAWGGGGLRQESSFTLEELASAQGVKPASDFAALLGDFWPEDEDADQFLDALCRWRREGKSEEKRP